jgi:glutathione S-transferase
VELVVASLNYSSWSVRAWLPLVELGLEFEVTTIGLFENEDYKSDLIRTNPTGKVPLLRDGDLCVGESLAICEYVNERYGEGRLWPKDVGRRAMARAAASEMATGFLNLREHLPMNHRARATDVSFDEATRWEIGRAQESWCTALAHSGGPFLFGEFSIADIFYVPVLSRFQTYGVELDSELVPYRSAVFGRDCVASWLAVAKIAPAIAVYDERVGA